VLLLRCEKISTLALAVKIPNHSFAFLATREIQLLPERSGALNFQPLIVKKSLLLSIQSERCYSWSGGTNEITEPVEKFARLYSQS
jgi:hypothetical protein